MSQAFAPVIQSLLDTDLYKFTMQQAILHGNPQAIAEYAFKCRNTPATPLVKLKAEIEAQLDHLCTLRFTDGELAYLGGLRFMKADYIDFLRLFQLQRRFITVAPSASNPDELEIRIKGPMLHVMPFEIYVLAIVNEVYFRNVPQAEARATGRERLAGKIARLDQLVPQATRRAPFIFFEFGTRRRFSREWQEEVVATLAEQGSRHMRGTSNVYLARKYGLTPIGTMAHEYLQAYQAFDSRLANSIRAALESWVAEYRGDLGIALTDVVGTDAFLRNFDLYFCKLFDGVRHDSGDPMAWGEKILAHYEKMRIDATTKQLVFSDSLDLERAFGIYERFADRTNPAFGIGTNLTNDCGVEPLNIVIKLVRCNDQPVAKVSDTSGKGMCEDQNYLNYLYDVFRIARQ